MKKKYFNNFQCVAGSVFHKFNGNSSRENDVLNIFFFGTLFSDKTHEGIEPT